MARSWLWHGVQVWSLQWLSLARKLSCMGCTPHSLLSSSLFEQLPHQMYLHIVALHTTLQWDCGCVCFVPWPILLEVLGRDFVLTGKMCPLHMLLV